jgi:hypothetical protein
LAWVPAARAAGSVPGDFFGIVPQGTLAQSDYDRMQGTVRTLRVPILWFQVEPQPGEYRFAELDETITRAAAAGVRVLPFVYGSPSWVRKDSALPPLGTPSAQRAWGGFLRQLVRRYGPDGDIWQQSASPMPIRRWQIWNEPNFLLFWRPRPSPSGYAQLLRISASAIRREDPGSSIVLAGVAPVEAGIRPWTFLRRMYRARGVRHDFDIVALHPYAPRVRWVADQIRFVRRVMAEAGDGRKPLLLTEIGIASGGRYPNAFDKGLLGQASFLSRTFRLLIARRHAWHLAGVDWFTWQDGTAADPHCVFCEYGGLLDSAGAPKPAWSAFQRIVEAATAKEVR